MHNSQKSVPLICAGLIIVIGLLILPPLFTAAAGNAPLAGPFAPNDLTIGRSQLLFTGLEQYIQDYDEQLPPMANATVFDNALSPYIRNPATFLSADTGLPFRPNAAVSGDTLSQLNSPGTTLAFSDSAPGQPTITTFLDGTVEQNGVLTHPSLNPTQQSVNDARELALGVEQYTQDWDETLPPMRTPGALEAAIYPYVKSLTPFTDPISGQAFVPNAALSGLTLADISNPAATVLLTSPVPGPDGFKTISYADGYTVHGTLNTSTPPGSIILSDANNLRRISIGIIQYVQDNDEHYPPMQSISAFEVAIYPYVGTSTQFQDPETNQPYQLNEALSGASLALVTDPTATWVIRDASANPDGSLFTGYADGHVAPTFSFLVEGIAVGSDDLTHLLWTKADGSTAFTTLSATGMILGTATNPSIGGQVAGYGVAPDGTQRLLFNQGAGLETLEALSSTGSLLNTSSDGPYDGWTPGPLAIAPSGQTVMQWRRYDGTIALRTLSAQGQPLGFSFLAVTPLWPAGSTAIGPDGLIRVLISAQNTAGIITLRPSGQTVSAHRNILNGLTGTSVAVGPDDLARVLWTAPGGQAQLWTLTAAGSALRVVTFAADAGWTPVTVAVGPDGNARVLWRDGAGDARIRFVSPAGVTLATLDYAPPQ